MIEVLIVTHGGLARELLAAARTISGELSGFRALSLDWKEGLEVARRRIAEEVASVPPDSQVLILTDMYGSTPTNAALEVAQPGRVEVISGVNLPMVVRLGCADFTGRDLAEIARCAMAKNPRTRYGTLSEFDAELARWQAKRPVAAVGGDWRYRVRKWLARREQSLSLAVTVGGVLWAALTIAGS